MMKRENQFALGLSVLGIVYCIASLVIVYVLVTVFERPLKDQEKKNELLVSFIESVERGEKVLAASDQAFRMRGFLLMIEGYEEVIGSLNTVLKYMVFILFMAGAVLLFAAIYIRTRFVEKSRNTSPS